MTRGAGGGRPAKPAGQARNRQKPTHDAVTLPVEPRKGRAPQSPLPLPERAEKLYRRLWRSQQATQWTHADVLPVARLALLASGMVEDSSKGQLEEMRHLEDRLGLHPHSRRQLRWALPGEDEADARPQQQGSVTRLRAVDPGGAASG